MSEIQEAIEIIKKSNDRLTIQIQKVKNIESKVEAVGLTEKYYSVLENCEKEYKACELAISALQDQAEREKENKPLTMEELRKMNNCPIWIVAGKTAQYVITYKITDTCIFASSPKKEFTLCISGYGKTWVAYAKEPVNI